VSTGTAAGCEFARGDQALDLRQHRRREKIQKIDEVRRASHTGCNGQEEPDQAWHAAEAEAEAEACHASVLAWAIGAAARTDTDATNTAVNRGYAFFDVKAVDSEQRIIEGFASTPTPDRGGDVMEPSGAQFVLPVPFLWFHDDRNPIGQVFSADVRPDGIYIKAQVSKVTTPGRLKTLVDEAWAAFTAKPPLVRGLSIGWKSLEEAPIKGTTFTRVLKWIWGELSAVTVPMNTNATILAVKQCDLAASGLNSPGVSGTSTVVRLQKAAPRMTIQEQITQFENTRAAKAARMNELMTKAGETGSTLDVAASEEHDTLGGEVKSIDIHLTRLHEMEKMNLAAATRVTNTTPSVTASDLRGGGSPYQSVTVKANVPKGTAFARMCMAMAAGHGDSYQTLQHAKQWKDSTPEVEQMVEHMWRTKAAVAVGTTTDATWAGPLVVTQPLNEFLELLRPRTLLGRIPGLRQVPFNVSVPSQTTGGTYGWVGQNKPKPVTKADYATVTVPFAKAAGIIVLSEELVTLSTPSAEALVREEMIAGMGAFLDVQFNDPAVAVAANVSPASITNGASTAAASGVTAAAAKADLAASIAVFTAANIPLEGSVWLMSDSNAFGLSVSLNALGQPLFPGITAQGGTLFGMPVVVSNNVSTRVILVHAPSILFADEGGVRIDVSREASVQMDSAPTDTVDATTVYLSLWQRNLIGLKAERMITWIRARTAAVRYITSAAYVGT
jgi:HK97 family phage major capsid protein